MTWSISASGKKSSVLETVNAATAPAGFPDSEQAAFDRAKAHAAAVVEAAPDDHEASVSASGHTTTNDGVLVGQQQSMSISTWLPTPTPKE